MGTKKTWVEIEHDEGYGPGLLDYLNIRLRGSDMIGRRTDDDLQPHKLFLDPDTLAIFERLKDVIEFPDSAIAVSLHLSVYSPPVIQCTFRPDLKPCGEPKSPITQKFILTPHK